MFEYQGDCHTSVATLVRNDIFLTNVKQQVSIVKK